MHRNAASVVRPFMIACAVLAVAAGASGSQAAVRKVLIIGIDGLRPDALAAADAPSIDALIADGAYSAAAQAEDITISGPGWSSMLTGVHRDKHGVTGNSFVGS
ncbi:MAG: alkaline phosphatase family protein, partial [Phycisphaerales bacterium]|nr:alkaline phosphatase family protein [Phycisphaerales bacterium]